MTPVELPVVVAPATRAISDQTGDRIATGERDRLVRRAKALSWLSLA
jgi:hypothetical protein